MRSLCLIREKHFVLVGCIVVGLLSCLVGCKQATDQSVTLSSSKTFQLSNPLIITKKNSLKTVQQSGWSALILALFYGFNQKE